MDLEDSLPSPLPSSKDLVKCCDCGCSCSLVFGGSSSEAWLRSVKRKYDEFEEGERFFIPGFDLFSNARVQIENECVALRETVSSQQQAIQDLYVELEEERNASSSAANEAMSMILRLQREKAEIQMEARQFKSFAEEKMAHDQQEISAYEDLLYKREQVIQSLTCAVQAYKHRMLSYGFTEEEVEGVRGERFSCNPSINGSMDVAQLEFPGFEYPPLKCSSNENPGPFDSDDGSMGVEKYAFGDTPHGQDHLKNLDYRISQMERLTHGDQLDGDFSGSKNVLDKVVVGQSPRMTRHHRRISADSSSSFVMSREMVPDLATESPSFKTNKSFKKADFVSHTEEQVNPRKMDDAAEFGDDTGDRVYTIDFIHNGVMCNGVAETKVGMNDDYLSTPRETRHRPDLNDPEIKKLYMRLQALEADRESMRQAIISMRTEKAQMVLLKEIAQHLCKDMAPERNIPVKKPSFLASFSFMSVFKWVASFIFWRKKACRSKYLFGLSPGNVGLLLLLDKAPQSRQWRCLTRTRV